ncbi:MAG: HesA/MoeB/ThiF family protein [Chloroflexi bacterium]|nr:HesA/MoeB/ThiF family protein [Chloroflexota bacterium]
MITIHEARYARQTALPQIGWLGQERLATASVTIVGCGGLGTVAAGLLARAGVGYLYLIDHDIVEVGNLHRQVLFDERDLGQRKAIAAAEKLRAINSEIVVEPVVARLSSSNAATLLAGSDLVLDGTDNDATRYLINEVCVRQGIPWVFAAVDENYGLAMAIVPGQTPCFSCIFGEPISLPMVPRSNKGLLGTVTHMVAAIQVGLAVRLLLGDDQHAGGLLYVDAWDYRMESMPLSRPPGGCGVCGDTKASRRF